MKLSIGNIVILILALGLGAAMWALSHANATLERSSINLRALAESRKCQSPPLAPPATSESIRLRERVDEEARLRTSIDALRAQIVAAEVKAAVTRLPRTVPPAGLWHHAGRASPSDTLHSIVAAAMNGEVDALASMLAFDAEGLLAAETLFHSLPEAVRSDFGNAETLFATMMSGRMPTSLRGADVIEQREESPDGMAVRFRLQRGSRPENSREVLFRFQRGEAGWSLIVPASVVTALGRP